MHPHNEHRANHKDFCFILPGSQLIIKIMKAKKHETALGNRSIKYTDFMQMHNIFSLLYAPRNTCPNQTLKLFRAPNRTKHSAAFNSFSQTKLSPSDNTLLVASRFRKLSFL